MHNLRQVTQLGAGSLSPYYPKFLVDEARRVTIVMSGGVGSIPHLLLESDIPIPPETSSFLSVGAHGTFFVILPEDVDIPDPEPEPEPGEPEVPFESDWFVTPYGTRYDGSMWMDAPLPEPTEQFTFDGIEFHAFAHPFVYALESLQNFPVGVPFEYKETHLVDPAVAVRLNLDGYEQETTDIALMWADPGNSWEEEPTYLPHPPTHTGAGNKAYSILGHPGSGGSVSYQVS